jgi:multicomponent Na+:H+ antiporter subunit E
MGRSDDILIPVADSRTLRNTVAYAVREALAGADADERPTLHFVYPIRWRPIEGTDLVPGDARVLLEKVEAWTQEDLESELDDGGESPVRTRFETIGENRYLFAPSDYADVLFEYAATAGVERVILDPEYQPGGTAPLLPPLTAELEASDLLVEEAPTARPARRGPIAARSTLRKFGLTFGVSYAFYLIVAGSLDTFNLATGGLVAVLSALLFAGITAERTPAWKPLFMRVARMFVYFPYLVWEIAKANLSVAYIILHPDLPIDPAMRKFGAAVWGDYSVTTLANSITLTPGTLTVDVRRDRLYIHTLTQGARDDLNDGGLERAVRFLFCGREAMHIPTPAERGSVEAPELSEIERGLEEAIAELAEYDHIVVPERPEGWETK